MHHHTPGRPTVSQRPHRELDCHTDCHATLRMEGIVHGTNNPNRESHHWRILSEGLLRHCHHIEI